jgi:hypothetical protein
MFSPACHDKAPALLAEDVKASKPCQKSRFF